MKFYILFLFIAFVTSQDGRADDDGKVFLTIYYESLCPDSEHFILKELQPVMDFMHDHLMLHLIPFGKASSLNNKNNEFQCQHGPAECLGNLIQDCVLNLMSSRTDAEKVEYVACEMKSKASTHGNLQCVLKANVPVQLVQDCISSGQGTALQLNSEYLTKLIEPKFIPTITVDGVFNQETQDNAMKDLIGTLCQTQLRDTKTCAEYYNALALMLMMD